MRALCTLAFASCLLLAGSGCHLFKLTNNRKDGPPPPLPTNNEKPKVEEIVAYLNREADKLNSIEAKDLSMTASMAGETSSVNSGSMIVQKPRNFRLVGKKFGDQVVLGSNDERFWFWVKPAQNTLYHCSYNDFEKGAELPIPFQPELVLEALGMSHVTVNENMTVKDNSQYFTLVEESTLRGKPIRKETMIHRGPARGDQPQVVSRTLFDASTGKVICKATVNEVMRKPIDNEYRAGEPAFVTCPKVIHLEWPQQDIKLVISLDSININRQIPPTVFQMPDIGDRQIDVGRDHPTGRVVPAGYR
jgi:hypothetical protein